MVERIIKIFEDLEISSYKAQNDLDGVVSQVSIRNILKGKTENPHQSTLDLLVNYYCFLLYTFRK